MFVIIGQAGPHRILLLGIPGSQLGGIRNSSMAATLDVRLSAAVPLFDGLSLLTVVRADSREELSELAAKNGIEVLDRIEIIPGIVEKPKGGLD